MNNPNAVGTKGSRELVADTVYFLTRPLKETLHMIYVETEAVKDGDFYIYVSINYSNYS